MNAVRPERSRAFWIWGFTFLLLLHGLAILRYGDRQKNSAPWQRPQPFLYAGGDPAIDERLVELAAERDPLLFALPHPQGFSGGAWLRFQPGLPRLSNWTALPEWLTLPADQLGKTLNEYVASNRPSDEPLLASLRAPRKLEVRLSSEPVVTNTTARIEGPLAARPVLGRPLLPAAAHGDVLRNTTVAVAVNGEGVVESAWLAGRSGSAAADERALQLARLFEFQPIPLREARAREQSPPVLGRIIFAWQVVPPTSPLPAATGAK